MRNLKRILSLALASTMLLGMMVIGAGAAVVDYDDYDQITYQEAADVMTSIGIFQGNNNEFNPEGDLTRESAAKIITYLVLGKNAADTLNASGKLFNDVDASRWSAGSIAYCVQNGIIAGDGQGNFYPELTVNGTGFAKMLLVALGYNANTERYVGTGWESQVAKQVAAISLNSGLSKGLSATLTREEAAQMALNTLKAVMVEYQGGTNVTLPDGTTVISGGVRVNMKDGNTKNLTFMKNYFPALKEGKGASSDEFNRPATTWKNGVKTIGTFPKTATETYTDSVKKADIENLLGTYGKKTDTVSVSVNGADSVPLGAEDLAKATGHGRLVEVYTKTVSDEETIDVVVVIDTFLAKISNINKVSKVIRVTPEGQTSIDVKEDDAHYATLAAMKKDDKVLITVADGAVMSVAVPETIEGTVTRINNDTNKHTIDGTTYDLSYKGTKLTVGDSFTVYLDTYGFVIGGDKDAVSASDYAFILDAERTGSGSKGFTYSIKMLFPDGTISWEEVTTADDEAMDEGDYSSTTTVTKLKGYVTYAVKGNGTYTVNKIDSTNSSTVAADPDAEQSYKFNSKISKGETNFADNSSTLLGTSKTIFLVATGSNSYKVYTGVKNVPSYQTAEVNVEALLAKGTRSASIVVLSGATQESSDTKHVFILNGKNYDTTIDADGDKVYTYNAIMDGEVTTVTTTTTKDAANNAIAQGLYKVTKNNGDYVSEVTSVPGTTVGFLFAGKNVVNPGTEDAKSIDITNGIVTTSDAKVMADDCVIVGYKENGTVAEGLEAGDVEFYDIQSTILVLDEDDIATAIYFLYE